MPKNTAELKLNYLKELYSNLPSQGSDAWLQIRKTKFGGSEIGRLINPKTRNEIINQKRRCTKINNMYCWWGNQFEKVVKHYLEVEEKIEIHEFGSIPSNKIPVAYSPDGLFIGGDDKLWLLEIKCPFMRHVNIGKAVPANYIAQVQTGMYILPCKNTLFLQFKFRRCYLKDINTKGKFDRSLHKDFSKHAAENEMWHGIFWWDRPHKLREEILMLDPDKIICNWEEDGETLNKFLEPLETGSLMCFKLFGIQEDIIPKDKKFIKKHKKLLWNNYEKLL